MDEQKKQHKLDELSRSVEQHFVVADEVLAEAIVFARPENLVDIVTGTILSERYEVLELVGKGGMGTVFRARHKLIGNIVAIKVLHTHLMNDDASRERFKAEAKAAISLRHQHLISVSDYGVAPGGQPYIVMDYIEGSSLADLLADDNHLEVEEFFDLFAQVCDGLANAHTKGIVHRDIKPSNIMLSKGSDGRRHVHIVDFGIAKVLPKGETPVQHLTQTGEIFGSPLYMSPEQCKGRSVDARSDIYSLGCVMFEALTGSPPHMGASAIETLMLHVNDTAPKISERRSGIAGISEVEQIVAKALSRDPDERYQTVNQLKTDIAARKFLVTASSAAPAQSSAPQQTSYQTEPVKRSLFQNAYQTGFMGPLIMALSAAATVWVVYTFNIAQPQVTTGGIGGAKEQQLHDASLEFQLAHEKASHGFNSEAAEYSQRALDIRAHFAPDSLVLAESLNQRADIAIHDAEHETMLLEGGALAQADQKIEPKVVEAKQQKVAADYTLAEKLLMEAVAIADAHTTGVEKSVSPVRFRSNLATVYLNQGNFEQAEKVLNKLTELFLANQPIEKSDPDSVKNAYHTFFDDKFERLYWGTGREVEAAKLMLVHHRPDLKWDKAAQDPSAPTSFTGRWSYTPIFSLDLKQVGNKIVGTDLAADYPNNSLEKRSTVTGTANDTVAHLTITNLLGKQTTVALVRFGGVAIFHVQKSEAGPLPGYMPDEAVLEFEKPDGEKVETEPAQEQPPPANETTPTTTES